MHRGRSVGLMKCQADAAELAGAKIDLNCVCFQRVHVHVMGLYSNWLALIG